ncbi:MAG: UDP-N-acetylglucosamine 2-epimerase (non-hydrolyzing), partial [Nanoarchaeota archaeon]
MKIVIIVGTRPNFMKAAPLIYEFKKHNIENVLVHTGQHYDFSMSKLFFDELRLPKPDEHLVAGANAEVKNPKEFLKITITEALKRHNPDLVIVVGDVNSTVAGAEAAHELGIKVAHVEAGLRSFDSSMPEENNRIRTDQISDFMFTTEKSGNINLQKEGITKDKIFFVGNVMIDSLLHHKKKSSSSKILQKINLKKNDYCVLTLHRPSNVDAKQGLEKIFSILEKIQDKIKIIFPIHPRTRKNIGLYGFKNKLKNMKKVIVTEPLGYLDFLWLMSNSKLILTDSGGIQEEATVLGIPCITLRENTERPVTVEQGTNLLVSTNEGKVVKKAMEVIENKIKIKPKIPELWDGKAAE